MNLALAISIFVSAAVRSASAGPPDKCCCQDVNSNDPASTCAYEMRCSNLGAGYECAHPSEGQCGTEMCNADCTCNDGGGDDGGGDSGGGGDSTCAQNGADGGPQIAMAWVSDQYANFDREYDWSKNCTAPSDPTDTESNQFKCCHDWLLDADFTGINVVSLAFVKPTEIMDPSTCSEDGGVTTRCTQLGVRIGIPGAINYFNQTMDLVFMSIGGVTYTESWEEALAENATEFADKVAAIAERYNCGIEIDYEESSAPMLAELETFIKRYRVHHPFEAVANPSPPSFLTLDFGQGAQFMGPTADWVAHNAFNPNPTERLLNWANAMVSGSRQSSYLVGSIWSSGRDTMDSCVASTGIPLLDDSVNTFIKTAQPCNNFCGECKDALPDLSAHGGAYSKGMLGWAYWMVGNIGPRQTNTCPDGVTITVYDNDYPGDGDCTLGFQAAPDGYTAVDGSVNWTSRVY